jgi:hypothetical protein
MNSSVLIELALASATFPWARVLYLCLAHEKT